MLNCRCGREYHPKQAWIHEPECRYLAGIDGNPEVEPNHVKPEKRGYAVTHTVTRSAPVTENVEVEDVTPMTNAERQRRYRERKRADQRPS